MPPLKNRLCISAFSLPNSAPNKIKWTMLIVHLALNIRKLAWKGFTLTASKTSLTEL